MYKEKNADKFAQERQRDLIVGRNAVALFLLPAAKKAEQSEKLLLNAKKKAP